MFAILDRVQLRCESASAIPTQVSWKNLPRRILCTGGHGIFAPCGSAKTTGSPRKEQTDNVVPALLDPPPSRQNEADDGEEEVLVHHLPNKRTKPMGERLTEVVSPISLSCSPAFSLCLTLCGFYQRINQSRFLSVLFLADVKALPNRFAMSPRV